MRNLFIIGFLSLFSQLVGASNSISVKDNGEFALTLSQSNFNRLLIKNDKILDFAFPDKAMEIKRDEQDGSVYVALGKTEPFTLFLTTESGRHYSVTVNGEESLGKTIELVPHEAVLAKVAPLNKSATQNKAQVPNEQIALINHMEHHEPVNGYKVKRQFGSAQRLQGGLTLLPKETWEGGKLKGEVIEVYNMSKKNMELTESWFANEGVKVIKLSQNLLAPREHAVLYRVKGALHG